MDMSRRHWTHACLSAAVLALSATLAFGHAVVQKASLDEETVRANEATRVTLTFNSRIESGFTKVVLVSAQGEERALDIVPASSPAIVTVQLPPLVAGSYGLRYKVLAVDGHVTENVLRFTVAPADSPSPTQ
jgi:methionine-rich copper-binding protein CopC